MSPAEAAHIIHRLQPGKSFTYYMGNMSVDRTEKCGANVSERGDAVASLADFMQTQGRNGEFINHLGSPIRCYGVGSLTQQRVAERVYFYIFTKTSQGSAL